MKVIILEGIATSGKTTIRNLLEEYFQKNNLSFLVVEEDETLMPFLHNTDENVAKQHLTKVILNYFNQNVDFLIFDRFYFTHIHRTNSGIENFREIEDLIKEKNGKIIFLKIDEKSIPDRIFNAMEHRSEGWKAYVESKGGREDIISYYTNQQRKLLKHLEETKVDFEILDSTNLDFNLINEKILQKI